MKDDAVKHALPKLLALASLVALILGAALVALMLGAGPAMGQFPAPQAGSPETPRAPAPSVSSLEGTVKKVDHEAGKVEVAAGWFGFFGRTLDVTPGTQIRVEGRPGALTEIREGDKVRAAYEVREGLSIARSINVVQEHDTAPPGHIRPSP